jgi:hypothetical protein
MTDQVRVLILLPFLAGCAHQDEWTTGDTVWQGIYTAVLLADCYAANEIQHHPNIIEDGEIAKMFMGTSLLGHFLEVGERSGRLAQLRGMLWP